MSITGVGLTKIGQHWDRSLRSLAVEAASRAMEDSGIEGVDAIFVGNMMSGLLNGQENLGSLLADYLGLAGIPSVKVEAACASGGAAAVQGFMAVKSGLFRRVLVVGVEKMTDMTDSEDVSAALATAADAEYEVFYGATFVSLNALIMRLYARRYGLSEEDFGYLPILMHSNASDTPHAQLRFKIDMERYLGSPMISDPLRLMDAAPVGDGAAAVVLEGSDSGVEVAGVGMATDQIALHSRGDLLRLPAVELAARRAMEMAGITQKEVDVFQIHDAFSVMGYLNMESIGLAEPGRAYILAESGEIARDGPVPVNPEGGLKARGHPVGATGIYQLAELYNQIVGRAGPSQVEGAKLGFAINVGGTGSNVAAVVLRGR